MECLRERQFIIFELYGDTIVHAVNLPILAHSHQPAVLTSAGFQVLPTWLAKVELDEQGGKGEKELI
uniref:Uncharacterized protein n=1 Tax=Oryza brachyantha TaxID=4533 RepID=J3MK87_ORYBR